MKQVLEAGGLATQLEAVVTAEDVYRGRPDPEAYLYAAQQLQRPPVRCVVVGNSNQVGPGTSSSGVLCTAASLSSLLGHVIQAVSNLICETSPCQNV